MQGQQLLWRQRITRILLALNFLVKVLAQQVTERLLVQRMGTLGQAANGVHVDDVLQEIHVGLVLANSEVLQVGTHGSLSQGSAACRGINDALCTGEADDGFPTALSPWKFRCSEGVPIPF